MKNFDYSKLEIDPSKIRAARGDLKLGEVAARIGVTKQAISNIENGRSKPSTDMLLRLCVLYRVDVRDLANKKNLAA